MEKLILAHCGKSNFVATNRLISYDPRLSRPKIGFLFLLKRTPPSFTPTNPNLPAKVQGVFNGFL